MSREFHSLDRPKPLEPAASTAAHWEPKANVETDKCRCATHVANDGQSLELQTPAGGRATGSSETPLRPNADDEAICLIPSHSHAGGPLAATKWKMLPSDEKQKQSGPRHPGSSIRRSGSDTQISDSTPPDKTTRPRRWSTGASGRRTTQSRSRSMSYQGSSQGSPTTSAAFFEPRCDAYPRDWCEEFCRNWTRSFEQAHWDLEQTWKGVCFAQLKGDSNVVKDWDKSLRAGIQQTWQPLNDLHHILQVYFHEAEAQNHKLYPKLTEQYMGWRTPDQVETHRTMCLVGEEGRAPEQGFDGDSPEGDGHTPGGFSDAGDTDQLTTHQLFKIARVFNDADWAVKRLQGGLNRFVQCRLSYVWVLGQNRYGTQPQYVRKVVQASKDCLKLSKCLVDMLKGSPNQLCKYMNLDPAKVPSCWPPGKDDRRSDMSGAGVTREGHIPRVQGGRRLPRSFNFQLFSLQAGRIALQISSHARILSQGATQAVSRRMLAMVENMENKASEVGEGGAEAKVRCLGKKIRHASFVRTGHETPAETISLLDSVTWPAVLEPRSGRIVKTHGRLAKLPLVTLLANIDCLLESPRSQAEYPSKSARNSRALTDSTSVGEPGAEKGQGSASAATSAASVDPPAHI